MSEELVDKSKENVKRFIEKCSYCSRSVTYFDLPEDERYLCSVARRNLSVPRTAIVEKLYADDISTLEDFCSKSECKKAKDRADRILSGLRSIT